MSGGRSFADAYHLGIVYENLVREHGYNVEVRDEAETWGRTLMITFRPQADDALLDTYVFIGSHGTDDSVWSTRYAYRTNTIFSRSKKEGVTVVFNALVRDLGLESTSKAKRSLGIRKEGK